MSIFICNDIIIKLKETPAIATLSANKFGSIQEKDGKYVAAEDCDLFIFSDHNLVDEFIKNLSDRQITLDKKLIDFIIKRVERSYGKIFEFIYKIDKISLKKKKSIDFKIIKEALEEQVE